MILSISLKRIALLVSSVFLAWTLNIGTILAEPSFVYDWAKAIRLGDSSHTYGDARLAVDSAGNSFIAGSFSQTVDFDPSDGVDSRTSSANSNVYVSKYSPSGAYQWTVLLPGSSVSSLKLDGNNNILLTGSCSGSVDFDPGPGVDTRTCTPSPFSAFTTKLDNGGNYLWTNTIGELSTVISYSLSTDQLGAVYVVGNFAGTVDFDPGPGTDNRTNTSSGNYLVNDMFFSKYDSTGSYVWTKQISGPSIVDPASVATDNNGSVYLSGTIYSSIDLNPGPEVDMSPNSLQGAFVSKYDTSGNYLWSKVWVGTGNTGMGIADLALDSSGNLYATGSWNGELDFDPGPGTEARSRPQFQPAVFLLKLDESANFSWVVTFGGKGEGSGNYSKSIAIDNADNIWVAGIYSDTADFDPADDRFYYRTAAESNDIFFAKFGSAGELKNVRVLEAFCGAQGTKGIAVDMNGNVLITGNILGNYNSRIDFDAGVGVDEHRLPDGITDVFLLKYYPDETPPTPPTVTVPKSSTVISPLPVITGSAEPSSTVVLYRNGIDIARVNTSVTGNWTYSELSHWMPGPYTVAAKATDRGLNTSSLSDSVSVTVTGALPDYGVSHTAVKANSPTPVEPDISVGHDHACGLTAGGGVKCWGNNLSGQLGDGSTSSKNLPVNVFGYSSGVASLSAGSRATCIVTSQGGAKCWGNNTGGELGNGTNHTSSTPVQVVGLNTGVAQVSAGYGINCARTVQGGVSCWGSNLHGDLGVSHNLLEYSLTPVKLSSLQSGVTKMSVTGGGAGVNCVVLANGSVKCWGNTAYGELGVGIAIGGNSTGEPIPQSVWSLSSGVYEISAGTGANCVIKSSNRLQCWGRNSGGEGTKAAQWAPVDVVGLGEGVTGVSTAYAHACALVDGGVRCWGSNDHGQLGDGSTVSQATPGYVSGLRTGVKSIGALGGFSCALLDTGFVKCWGYNGQGQLGNKSTIDQHIPVFVQDECGLLNLKSATVCGQVRGDGVPLPGVRVRIEGLGESLSDQKGNYSISGASYGAKYNATVLKTGYIPDSQLSIGPIVGGTRRNYNLSSDVDHDGLLGREEEQYGTDPSNSDSDNDGVIDGEEVQSGTNPVDRGSVLPQREKFLCAEWNGFLHMDNVLETFNRGTTKIGADIAVYNIFGKPQSRTKYSLLSNSQRDFLVHDLRGFERNSYGLVCGNTSEAFTGWFDGRMIFYKANLEEGGYEFAFAIPLSAGRLGKQYAQCNTFQPSFDPKDKDNLAANWIQVTNLESVLAKGYLLFYDQNGKLIVRERVIIDKKGRRDISCHDRPRQPHAGLVEWIPDDSKQHFQFRNVRYYYRADSAHFDSATQMDGVVGSGELQSVFFDSTNGTSSIEISNTLATSVTATINLYQEMGGKAAYTENFKLLAHQTRHIVTNSLLNTNLGVATIKGNKPESLVVASFRYALSPSKGINSVSNIQGGQALGTHLKGSYNSFIGQSCRILITNPSELKVSGTLGMKSVDGRIPVSGRKLSIPAHGLLNLDLCSLDRVNSYGVVSLEADVPNSLFSVVVRTGETGDYEFSTPVTQ